MIIQEQKQATILTEGEISENIKMSLDLESAEFLMQMMSKNFYSDPIGSTVRETASNALDSHRRIGSKDPIIVSLQKNHQGNWEFSVEDFGTGMDDYDVENIISKYGKSTKRDKENELGAMGLGFKAPLSYSSAFYFTCRKNGIERKYMMSEGETGNEIGLLYEKETNEKNGVKVIVPIKYSEWTKFQEAIRWQLSYFEGVYFNVPGIDNDFIISRHEDFQWSELCKDGSMHICLDNVYYPIDYNKLQISTIYLPIALRFSLTDGINPVPNRESIKYTLETADIIVRKIKKVANFFVSKYNEKIKETNNLVDIIQYYRSSDRILELGNKKLNINQLVYYSDVAIQEPCLEELKLTSLRDFALYKRDGIFNEYELEYKYEYGKVKYEKHYKRIDFEMIINHVAKVYVFTDVPSRQKWDFIKDRLKDDNVSRAYFIKKKEPFKLGSFTNKYATVKHNTWYGLLQLHAFPKSEWRERIKESIYIKDILLSNVIDLDKIHVTPEWIQKRKEERASQRIHIPKTKKVVEAGQIKTKTATNLSRSVEGKTCKFEDFILDLQTLYKNKRLHVYALNEESNINKIQLLYPLFKYKVDFYLLSERELKKTKNISYHNWISLKDFSNQNHRIFKKRMTQLLISSFKSNYNAIFNNISLLKEVNPTFHNKLKYLIDYYYDTAYISCDCEDYKNMMIYAESNKLLDLTAYSILKEVENILNKVPMLNDLFEDIRYRHVSEGTLQSINCIFRYHKIRTPSKTFSKEEIN